MMQNLPEIRSTNLENDMTLTLTFIIEIFDYWDIDLVGSFLSSNGYLYILLTIDYVSKRVEAIACRNNDQQIVIKFLRENILSGFRVSIEITSNEGSHFRNSVF